MRETEGAAPASQAVGYDIAAVAARIARRIPALRPPLVWTWLEGRRA